jgi:hypothetical protein
LPYRENKTITHWKKDAHCSITPNRCNCLGVSLAPPAKMRWNTGLVSPSQLSPVKCSAHPYHILILFIFCDRWTCSLHHRCQHITTQTQPNDIGFKRLSAL